MNDVERVSAAAPEILAELLGGAGPAGLLAGLFGEPRFSVRLREMAIGRLGELPRPDARQLAALALTSAGLSGLALRAGAIWHAGRIARVVEAGARRQLVASFGPEACAAALRGRHLCPDQPEAEGEAADDDLAAAAAHDGACCWTAWCRKHPPPIAARLMLLGGGAPAGPAHAAFGPAIVEWVLERR